MPGPWQLDNSHDFARLASAANMAYAAAANRGKSGNRAAGEDSGSADFLLRHDARPQVGRWTRKQQPPSGSIAAGRLILSVSAARGAYGGNHQNAGFPGFHVASSLNWPRIF